MLSHDEKSVLGYAIMESACSAAKVCKSDIECGGGCVQGKDAFGRASVDVFQFACKAVGQMQVLRISHNNAGAKPDWHLDRVMHPVTPCLAGFSHQL